MSQSINIQEQEIEADKMPQVVKRVSPNADMPEFFQVEYMELSKRGKTLRYVEELFLRKSLESVVWQKGALLGEEPSTILPWSSDEWSFNTKIGAINKYQSQIAKMIENKLEALKKYQSQLSDMKQTKLAVENSS